MSISDNKRSRRIMQRIEHKIPEMNNKAITDIVAEVNQLKHALERGYFKLSNE